MRIKPLTTLLHLLLLIFAFAMPPAPVFAMDDEAEAVAVEVDEDEKEKEEEKEDEERVVFEAHEIGLISEQKGKAVIVKGTVKKVWLKSTGNVGVSFEECDLEIFIPKDYVRGIEDERWGFADLEKKEIFVAGQAAIYGQKVQVHISRPDQIADAPHGFDLDKVLMPKRRSSAKKSGPAAPGAIYPRNGDLPAMELKLEEASVQTVAFYLKDTGMKVRGDPFGLPVDRLIAKRVTVSASVQKMEGIGPMQVAFPKPDPERKNSTGALLDELAESYGKWPQDALVTIDVDFETRAFKDDPARLVIAALIHSLVTGKEIPSSIVLSAEVGEAGALEPPRANVDGEVTGSEILQAVAADAVEPMRLICSDMEINELNDLALDGDWTTLSSVSAIAAESLPDALNLIFADAESDLGKALAAFDQAQAVIKKSGHSMVKNSHVQQRVLAAGKAWRLNKSAVFYVYYAKNKVPRTYSLPRTLRMASDLHTEVRYLRATNPDDAKGKFRELGDKVKGLRSKFNPDLATLARALEDFEREASNSALRPRDGSAGERQEKNLKQTDEKVVAELEVLSAKISGEEPEAEEEEE